MEVGFAFGRTVIEPPDRLAIREERDRVVGLPPSQAIRGPHRQDKRQERAYDGGASRAAVHAGPRPSERQRRYPLRIGTHKLVCTHPYQESLSLASRTSPGRPVLRRGDPPWEDRSTVKCVGLFYREVTKAGIFLFPRGLRIQNRGFGELPRSEMSVWFTLSSTGLPAAPSTRYLFIWIGLCTNDFQPRFGWAVDPGMSSAYDWHV